MQNEFPNSFKFRNSRPSDHKKIIVVLKDWWDGRDLTWMLPRLFLVHFCNTSFVIEKDGELVAFLIGFLSPAQPKEGYIHFSGVHPDYRGIGIGKTLYDLFFRKCRENNRTIVKCCTSPINKGSIEFHRKMGFSILTGDAEVDGIQVTLDYNRPDDPKIQFQIEI